MCWVGGWHLLHLLLLQGSAIPNKAAQGMPKSPLDPHPGSHLGEIDFVHLLLVVTLMMMTHWHLPPL